MERILLILGVCIASVASVPPTVRSCMAANSGDDISDRFHLDLFTKDEVCAARGLLYGLVVDLKVKSTYPEGTKVVGIRCADGTGIPGLFTSEATGLIKPGGDDQISDEYIISSNYTFIPQGCPSIVVTIAILGDLPESSEFLECGYFEICFTG